VCVCACACACVSVYGVYGVVCVVYITNVFSVFFNVVKCCTHGHFFTKVPRYQGNDIPCPDM